ncbi:hypothetical protein Ahia01_001157600, partial [Argonauta hians]
ITTTNNNNITTTTSNNNNNNNNSTTTTTTTTISTSTTTSIVPTTTTTTSTPSTTTTTTTTNTVYPPDAAIQAIRRFSARPPFPELMEAREGPVTKHIRLTAALILRNLSRFSTLGRRLMMKHEPYLGYTAMSAVESSNALANCLWEILENNH